MIKSNNIHTRVALPLNHNSGLRAAIAGCSSHVLIGHGMISHVGKPCEIILVAIFLLQAIFLQAQTNVLPEPMGFVSDYAEILMDADKYAIEELATEAKQKSGAEIALLTVKTIEPYGSIEEYANEVFNKWGIGEKGKDNGVLIVLSTTERALRIEVGYGLEGAITDGHAGSIMDKYMIPYFQQNDFSAGLLEGYKAVMTAVAKEYNFEILGFSDREYSIDEAGETPLIVKIFGLLFFIFFFGSFGSIWLLFIFAFFGAFRKGFGKGFDGGRSGFGGRSSFSSGRSSFSRSSSSRSFSRGSSGGGGSSRRF